MLRKLINRKETRHLSIEPSTPEGMRIYAIGDIHGCWLQLEQILQKIQEDNSARGTAETALIFLGDLIDRGPNSREVVSCVKKLSGEVKSVTILKGNHEEVFLRCLAGDRRAATLFNRIGGRETAISYGVSPKAYDDADIDEMLVLIKNHVPDDHAQFISSFQDYIILGDYYFAHAGVRPGVPLLDQKSSDLRWIREDFLESERDHGAMIVHGHSISPLVEQKKNRLGIDTGAYATGTLTAVGLSGSDRWFLQT